VTAACRVHRAAIGVVVGALLALFIFILPAGAANGPSGSAKPSISFRHCTGNLTEVGIYVHNLTCAQALSALIGSEEVPNGDGCLPGWLSTEPTRLIGVNPPGSGIKPLNTCQRRTSNGQVKVYTFFADALAG
jgi:hypothetical protein